jgi:hypothetical protein
MKKLWYSTAALLALSCPLQARAASLGESLHIFTDASVIYSQGRTFAQIGSADLFMAGAVDPDLNYLAEVEFETSPHGVSMDLERSYLQYVVSPWLKIKLGRLHTPTGFWNDTYHHGTYLHTSIARPKMEQFEDSGGILPAHTTGVMIDGEGDLWGGQTGYTFGVGNGRGPVKDTPAFYVAYTKSASFMLSLYQQWDSGLRLGPNFYFSQLPGGIQQNSDGSPLSGGPDTRPGATNTNNAAISGPKGNEYIGGFHVVYQAGKVEWLNEYQYMVHTYAANQVKYDGSAAANTKIHLFYTQFAYTLGRFKPYLRFELDKPNGVDAYLNAYTGNIDPGLLGTLRAYILGGRYELTASSALKLECNYTSSSAPLEQQYKVGSAVLAKKTAFSSVMNWSVGW